MKKLLNLKWLLMLNIILFVFLTGCTNKSNDISDYQKNGVLKIGTNAQFPPFEFYDNDKITGFDIELAQLVAKRLGVKLVIEDMNFNTLIDALDKDKVDLIFSGITITNERQTKVDFSIPYYESEQAIMVMDKNQDIKSVNDLKNKRIGVQTGTTGEEAVSKIEGAKISRYNTALAAIMDMKSLNIDAIIFNLEACREFKESNPNIRIIDEGFAREQYAIAAKKGQTEIISLVDEVINEIKSNGQYDELVKKYFEKDAQ